MNRFFSSSPVMGFTLLALSAASTSAARAEASCSFSVAADTAVSAPAATVLITGRVEGLRGVLPGSVVAVKIDQKAIITVTNANGEFTLPLPAAGGPWPATVSYAGYVDVATTLALTSTAPVVKLTTPRVIKVARKQQLRTYRRTAQRQIRRTLRRV